MVEQILGLLIGVFGPLLGIPKEWVTADERTMIHFNEKTTQKVQRRRAKFYCEVHVVKAKEEGHISEALLNKKRCRYWLNRFYWIVTKLKLNYVFINLFCYQVKTFLNWFSSKIIKLKIKDLKQIMLTIKFSA